MAYHAGLRRQRFRSRVERIYGLTGFKRDDDDLKSKGDYQEGSVAYINLMDLPLLSESLLSLFRSLNIFTHIQGISGYHYGASTTTKIPAWKTSTSFPLRCSQSQSTMYWSNELWRSMVTCFFLILFYAMSTDTLKGRDVGSYDQRIGP